jgi:hypothetical protein
MPLPACRFNQDLAVVQVQPRRGIGIGHRVELAALDAVLAGGPGNELEQALGAIRTPVDGFVEAAAGFYVGKAQEIIARDAALVGFAFDDVQDLGPGVVTCHRFLHATGRRLAATAGHQPRPVPLARYRQVGR